MTAGSTEPKISLRSGFWKTRQIRLTATEIAVMIVGVLLAVHSFIGNNKLLDLAVITYMSSPATFSMQTFLKREDGSAYVSTTNSIYCIVSIVVYMILAFITY